MATFAWLAFVNISLAQLNVVTERYDNLRTGANLAETKLNSSNVKVNTFGKLWSYIVSGSIYAQPLYVADLNMGALGTHNVLFVVTMNDVVYAFDADSSSNTPLWFVDLTTQVAGSTPVPINDIVPFHLNIVGNVGIESTPQIDLSTRTMYLVARTKERASSCGMVNGNYCQRLHALDITSGVEKFGGPVVIQGSVPGTGNASVGGTLTFDPKIHNQRSSLALANGQIFIGWGSHEDLNAYHGWVMAYNAMTLTRTGIFCSSPDGAMAGIWMAGRAPAVDASGNVYYVVGNGDWNGQRNFGESMLKFGSTAGMPVLSWFTPDTWAPLNSGDVDYGSSGPLLIPDTDLVTAAGKSSVFYVTHTGSLGHEQPGNGQIAQSLLNNGGEVKGGPVYWNRASGTGPWMYIWSDGADRLKAYHFNGTTFDASTISQSLISSPPGSSGGVLTLSANGSAAGSGIVWASMPLTDDGDHGVHQGVLRALNADDLTQELWNSRLNAIRDDMGNWPKFSPPTVVNGRVYMGSFPTDGVSSSAVNVYGILPSTPDFSISASPASKGVAAGGAATYTLNTGSMSGFSGDVSLSIRGLPSGATASFSAATIGTPGSSTLTVSTTANTPLSTFTVTISGISGQLSHSTTVTLTVTNLTPGYGAISIDFVGSDNVMAPAEIAGVVSKSNWNAAQGSNGSNQSLTDETGNSSGATLTWTSGQVWRLSTADTPGDSRMMKGYLDSAGQNTTVSVAALPVNPAGYDIYVYADGDNGAAVRTGEYQISGTGIPTTSVRLTDAANTNFSGAYTQANNSLGNFVKFSIITSAFTLTAIPGAASDGIARAPVNGIQIVPRADVSDFSLVISPPMQTVAAGDGTSFTATITGRNGFAGAVTFSITGLPGGATGSFAPSSVSGSGSSTFSVASLPTTPTGTSTLTITAASGSLAHSVSVSLIVNGRTPAAMPAFAPAGGTYTGTQVVTLTDSMSGALIYYTTDGSTPTPASTKYVNAINVASTITLKAIAVAPGFTNSTVALATYTINPMNVISQAAWTLKFADSQETGAGNYAATNAFDGKANTFWHTQWRATSPPPPHEIQINLGASYAVNGFTYLPRQDGCLNGTVKQYEFYVSADGLNWGTAVATGNFNYGSASLKCGGGTILGAQQVTFPSVTGQYIRFRALSEVNGNPWTSVGEINILH